MSKKINLRLKELDEKSFQPITLLNVFDNQKKCVASNAFSIAQAYFHKEAWFRGIYVDDTAVGFVMLQINHIKPEYYLWRFMIDKNHQKKGYGKLALDEVVKYVKQFPQALVLLSSVEMEGNSPLEFYKNYGFEETDEWDEGEKVIVLKLR